MRGGVAVVVLASLLAGGCRTGQGVTTASPPRALAGAESVRTAFEAGELLPAGRVVGRVLRLQVGAFGPAADVDVRLDEGGVTARSEVGGGYGFDRVSPGLHRVSVAVPGMLPLTVAFRVGTTGGLGRVNLVLVPEAGQDGGPAGVLLLAGVAVDPRGAALPGATVRVADSLTVAGNAAAQANADGAWVLALPGARGSKALGGVASLTCHGRTPGGVAVEATEVMSLAIGTEPALALVAGTRAFAVPRGLAWEPLGGRRGRIVGEGLSTRRDEVVLRVTLGTGVVELPPAQAGPEGLTVELPVGAEAPSRVELLPLGLVPPGTELPGVSL